MTSPPWAARRALLAFLLLSDAPVRREKLAAFFWGDRGEDQASASLRQCFYELRRLTGGEPCLLVVDRAQARANGDVVESDLDRLRAVTSVRDVAEVVALLAEPDFLLDLNDIDADFDAWLSAERARRLEERRTVALRFGERALAEGEVRGVRMIGERLANLDPLDEEATRLLMTAAVRGRDRDAARRALERHNQAMRIDLGSEPNPALLALLEVSFPSVETPAPWRDPVPDPIAERAPTGRRSARWILVGAGMALVILALGAVAWRGGVGADRIKRVLVQPLAVSDADVPARTLAHGLATDVSEMIVGNDANLRVSDAADGLRGRADYLLTGEARSGADGLHADIRLLDAGSRAILWSRSFTRPADRGDALREQMAARIADVMICGVGGRNPRPSALGVEAMRLYLEACDEKHGDWTRSAKLLEEVIRLRPRFAHAWAMLAAATAATATVSQPPETTALIATADRDARHALALDPRDSEAFVALEIARPGMALWSARDRLLHHALAVDPESEVGNIDMAENLASVGRNAEALIYARRVAQLDPGNQWAVLDLIEDFGFHGMPDGVGPLITTADRRWPNDPDLAWEIFRYHALAGDPLEAERRLDDPRRPFSVAPDRLADWRALIRARRGLDVAEAVHRFEADLASDDVGVLFKAADAFAALHRPDLALAALDRIGERPIPASERLFRDYWAPVRADPRFMTVAARQGLVALWRRTGRWPDFCGEPGLPYDCETVARRPS